MRYISRLIAVGAVTCFALLAVLFATRPVNAAGPWYVSPTGDDGASCLSPAAACATIQAAVDKAADGDEIRVATGTYVGASTAVVAISKTLNLRGGWDGSFTAQTGLSRVDGENLRLGFRIWNCIISPEIYVSIDRFHIVHGGVTVPCIGTYTTLSRSLLSDSLAGGIANSGIMTITETTITNNSIPSQYRGSAIINTGQMTVEQSTISNNLGNSGAIDNPFGSSRLTLMNSTVSDNGVMGITNVGALILQNSILANHSFLNCREDGTLNNPQVVSRGHNIVEKQTCLSPTATDYFDVDPRLGPLQDNGGLTPTQALGSDSPAINGGPASGCLDGRGAVLTTDQRGAPRSGVCDIGAFESTLGISKTVTGAFLPGGQVTYTLSLNTLGGELDLAGARIIDDVPALLTLLPQTLSASQGNVSLNGNRVAWTGTVSSAMPVVVTFSAIVSPQAVGQAITNTATGAWQGYGFASNASAFDTISRLRLPALARNACKDFVDTFSDPTSGWSIADSATRRSEYLNGEYRVQSKLPGYLFLQRAPTCPRENYTAEVDVRWEGATGSDLGLIFGVTGAFDQFYMLDINTDYRAYAVYRFNADDTVTVIASPQVSSYINAGTSVNHLKILRDGDYTLYVMFNDGAFSYYDSAITGLTHVGLVMAPYDDRPVADARFDNFKAYAYPLGSGSAMSRSSQITASGIGAAVDWEPNLSGLTWLTP